MKEGHFSSTLRDMQTLLLPLRDGVEQTSVLWSLPCPYKLKPAASAGSLFVRFAETREWFLFKRRGLSRAGVILHFTG